MNSGDVYNLDANTTIYLWTGAASSAHERAKAANVAAGMAADRGGGVRVVPVADEAPDEDLPFWKLMPRERRFLGIKCDTAGTRESGWGGVAVAGAACGLCIWQTKRQKRISRFESSCQGSADFWESSAILLAPKERVGGGKG
jgi:hypothetical protein